MRFLKKSFLVRRRWDRGLVWLGGMGLPLRHGITPAVAVFFAVVGVYLVAARSRSRQGIAGAFLLFALSYLVYTLALIVVRGEPFDGNRQVGYSLLIGLLPFIANGMVLVRDPLRCFVIGARMSVVLIGIIALWSGFDDPDRFGMGGNSAPFAVLAAFTVVTAIIPITAAPRWAPNSLIYIFIGAIPILASQTRAVIVTLPLIMALECVLWLKRRSFKTQLAGYAFGAAALGIAVSIGPVHQTINERFVPIVQYYAGDSSAWETSETANVRLALWSGAARAFAESPIIGHGHDRMGRIVELAPTLNEELRSYHHIHNLVLDELLQHGLVGLLILAGVIVCGAHYAIRHADSDALRRSILYAMLILVIYGMFHNPMLHESTIAALFFYLGVVVAHGMRCRAAAEAPRMRAA